MFIHKGGAGSELESVNYKREINMHYLHMKTSASCSCTVLVVHWASVVSWGSFIILNFDLLLREPYSS